MAISPETKKLAEDLIKSGTVDKAAGTIVADKDFYVRNLPEGLTAETEALANNYRASIVAAGALALDTVAPDEMKKNGKLNTFSVTINGTGGDKYEGVYNRKTVSQNPAKPGEQVVSHGSIVMKVRSAAVAKRGEFNEILKDAKARAATLLAD